MVLRFPPSPPGPPGEGYGKPKYSSKVDWFDRVFCLFLDAHRNLEGSPDRELSPFNRVKNKCGATSPTQFELRFAHRTYPNHSRTTGICFVSPCSIQAVSVFIPFVNRVPLPNTTTLDAISRSNNLAFCSSVSAEYSDIAPPSNGCEGAIMKQFDDEQFKSLSA